MRRGIDNLGRVSIPAEMRREIGLENGMEVNIELESNKVILTNPKGIKSREEIERKIKRLYKADDINETMQETFIAALKWVLNEED